jgi:hypothetical protein
MKADFEIKYLDITWYDKETVLRVTESFVPLTIDYDVQKQTFTCDAILYPEAPGIKHGQLAFRLLVKSNAEPYFELADSSRVVLKKVVDTETGKTWWVEANHWVAKNKVWERKSHRTAGKIKARLNQQQCEINIGSSEFTAAQLEHYLADFKSDLWELILDESSYITGEGKKRQDGGVNEESIAVINNILSHAQKILKKPKSELREVQMLKPRKMVKPVTRTFMELATKGDGRFLTSRATKPSYNVPENSYVLFALDRIFKILKQLVTISGSKINRFDNNIQKLEERHQAFSDEKLINKDLVLKDLEKLRLAFNLVELNRLLSVQLQDSGLRENNSHGLPTWYIKITNKLEDNKGYFVGVKINPNDSWFEYKTTSETVILNFDNQRLSSLFSPYLEYKVIGYLEQFSATARTGKPYHRYTLKNLFHIEIVGGDNLIQIEKKYLETSTKIEILKANNWIKKLTYQEISEQNREKRSVQNQINFYQISYEKVKHVYTLLSPKLSKYKALLNDLRKLEIKPLSTFSNSMTFVQNPAYQAIHSGYKKVCDFTNLSDEDLLLSLENVEELGLINMPLLYERWCLLQIIKVLVQNYNYVPSDDWKRKLLRIVETGKHNQSIKFKNENLKRSIELWYEPTLENGRTPDFVMDVFFKRKNGTEHKKRLVMDAKFYSDDLLRRIGGISKVVNDLYHKKDYSEGGNNGVFILHPAKNSIPEKVSPQIWGNNSYLGELKLFEWDDVIRGENFHQYGAVCANPVLRLSYLDEFQRLLGMFIQYGIEDNNLQGRPDDVEAINFCIACGSHDIKHIEKSNSNSRSSWYECNSCQHFTTYNHCHRCDTRLIKNGDYWTYHSQMPMEPLNIKCPKCESLV